MELSNHSMPVGTNYPPHIVSPGVVPFRPSLRSHVDETGRRIDVVPGETAKSPALGTSSTIFVSSYPPQQCGIATFTEDLLQSVVSSAGPARTGVVAVGEGIADLEFPPEVVHRIRKNDRASYLAAAHYLNTSPYDVVCVQHEFGLFGGAEGSYLLDLLYTLRKPVVTTLHTVLANPTENYRARTIEVVNASDSVIVLTPKAIELLSDVYGISSEKVRYIPHGIPDMPYVDPERHKARFGLEGRIVLMTFGLIGPSKGIDQMIDVMPTIAARHPEVLYMVVGATHPGVLECQGESYRRSLEAKVEALGIGDNVRFLNRYLDDDEVCDYLKACDIYVTPYQSRDQISSGTLSYAAGMGRAVVSTGYWYAMDLLGDGRGRLVDFGSPEALAAAVERLVENPDERRALGRRAYDHCRRMVWSNVASDYLELFGGL